MCMTPLARNKILQRNGMFKKNDKGKLERPELIDPDFLLGLSKVLAQGAAKYSDNNWKEVNDINRYIGALQRHALNSQRGDKIDEDSGLSHMLHVAANAMFIYWYEQNHE